MVHCQDTNAVPKTPVGENSGKLGGYHFWYKYFLDDGNGKVDGKDSITFDGRDAEKALEKVPEIVTLDFRWNPEGKELVKTPKGGFWVGCSPEGLMALGMARWKEKTVGKTEAVINKTRYQITLYTDIDRRKRENKGRTDDKYINTFWPAFVKRNEPAVEIPAPEGESSNAGGNIGVDEAPSVRIIRALVDPEGDDGGEKNGEKETVTLQNVTSSLVVIKDWTIEGRNGKTKKLTGSLNPGQEKTFPLSGDDAQLSNKGKGEIILKNSDKKVVDGVEYSEKDVKEGSEVEFRK